MKGNPCEWYQCPYKRDPQRAPLPFLPCGDTRKERFLNPNSVYEPGSELWPDSTGFLILHFPACGFWFYLGIIKRMTFVFSIWSATCSEKMWCCNIYSFVPHLNINWIFQYYYEKWHFYLWIMLSFFQVPSTIFLIWNSFTKIVLYDQGIGKTSPWKRNSKLVRS